MKVSKLLDTNAHWFVHNKNNLNKIDFKKYCFYVFEGFPLKSKYFLG